MSREEQAGDFCWDALGSLALHPVRMEIIEALRWLGMSLSATDLARVFEGRCVGLRVEYHLRRLSQAGVVRQEDPGGASAAIGQRSYCLAGRATP